MGRARTSSYTRPRYSPITPVMSSCAPPMKSTDTIVEAQPGTALSVVSRTTIAHTMTTNDSPAESAPSTVASRSGLIEKDSTPSEASRSIFLRGYFVSPA
jgi:hypothetical protein